VPFIQHKLTWTHILFRYDNFKEHAVYKGDKYDIFDSTTSNTEYMHSMDSFVKVLYGYCTCGKVTKNP
jgi:hypothetical protein